MTITVRVLRELIQDVPGDTVVVVNTEEVGHVVSVKEETWGGEKVLAIGTH